MIERVLFLHRCVHCDADYWVEGMNIDLTCGVCKRPLTCFCVEKIIVDENDNVLTVN